MLEDKRIIVTGSARGMGLATLTAFVQAGARVVGMDINDADGEQAARTCTLISRIKAVSRRPFRKPSIGLVVSMSWRILPQFKPVPRRATSLSSIGIKCLPSMCAAP